MKKFTAMPLPARCRSLLRPDAVVRPETPVGFGHRWAGSHRQPSITFRGVFVRRPGRRSVAGDLGPAGMRPGECSGEGDAAAGDLCAGRVRKSERRGDGDSSATPAARCGDDNRRLMVRATIDADGLVRTKAYRAGDRDNGRAHIGGGAHCGGACRANSRDRGGLLIRARIDQYRLAGSKAGHTGEFDVGRAGG